MPIFPEQRLCLAGVGYAKLAASFLPSGEADGHVAAFHAAVAHQLIEQAQKLRGLQLLRRKAAQNSCGHGSIERGGGSLSTDISQRNAQLLSSVGKKIV